MKICSYCGEENPDNKNWCKKCMKPLRDDPAEALPLEEESVRAAEMPEEKMENSSFGILKATEPNAEPRKKSQFGIYHQTEPQKESGRIHGGMGPKKEKVPEKKPQNQKPEKEEIYGLYGRMGPKEYVNDKGRNSRIIHQKPKRHCINCGQPIDGEDTLCPKCRKRKKKTKTIWLRVVAAVLVVAMWSSVAVYFVENRTPKVKNAEQAISVLKDLGEELGYENAFSELTEKNTTTIDGDNYYRLQQFYQNVPVYGKTVVCATDENGKVTSLTGNLIDVNKKIALTPTTTTEQVTESVKAYLSNVLGIDNTNNIIIKNLGENNLCIYIDPNGTYSLAYCVYAKNYELLVSATSGSVLRSKPLTTNYSNAEILDDLEITYSTMPSGSIFLQDTVRNISVHKLEHTEDLSKETEDLLSDESKFYIINPESDVVSGVYAMASTAKAYDYFSQELGRTGHNNNNGPCHVLMCSAEILCDQAKASVADQAAYLFVGVPSNLFTAPIGKALDIIAHEYTHLITQTEVGFIDGIEQTAISEALSDILGNAIEAFYRDGIDIEWRLGEDAGYCKYSMSNTVTMEQFDSNDDSGHINAQIIAHTAYLMWNGIDGIDSKKICTDDLAELWYRAMLMMPSDCNFVECRTLVELAASNMNLTDMQKQCVCEAFDAVGIPRASEEEYSELVHLVTDGETAIKGTVYEVKTVDGVETVVPVPKATMTVYDEEASKVCKKLNMKNKDGFFEIELPAGTYSVSITAEGYIGQTITFELDDNKVRYFSIEMKSKAVEVPTETPTEKPTESPTVAPTEAPVKGDSLSGKCGDNLTWTLKNGVLTISGTGRMYDYDPIGLLDVQNNPAPWYDYGYNNEITAIEIGNGVTYIGSYAFACCWNIDNIRIPGNVKCIGNGAFSWCCNNYDKKLQVTIEEGVETIEDNAFSQCFTMMPIELPDSLTYIGDAAFSGCYLKNIIIPPNVIYIGGWQFESDEYYEIEEIHFTGDVPEFAENTFIGVDVTAYYPANNKTWTPDVLKDYDGNVTWIAEGKIDENGKALAAYRPIAEKYNVSSQEQSFGWYSGILIDLDSDNVQELVLQYLSAPFEDAWWSEHKLSVYDYENGKVVTKLDGVTFGEIGGAGEDTYATILYKSGKPYIMTYNDFGETCPGGSMKPNRVGIMTIYDGKTCEETGVYRIERWDNVMSYQIDQRTVSEKEFVNAIEQYQGVDVVCDLYQLIEFPETFVSISKLLQQMK